MNKEKKLSIIIPLYNQEELVIKALDSIDERDDIEIIVIDDGSTDKSFSVVYNYIQEHKGKTISLDMNKENSGVGVTIAKGLGMAKGEYVCILCSDDYYEIPLAKVMFELDGTDMVYYNLVDNNGNVWELNNSTKNVMVGATKFMRKSFIGNTKRSSKRFGGDYDFYMELLGKSPTEKFLNINLYHYNFLRENSLIDQMNKGAKD